MEENLGAASWTLTDDEVATLERVSARPLPYPYWHQQRFNTPRCVISPATLGHG